MIRVMMTTTTICLLTQLPICDAPNTSNQTFVLGHISHSQGDGSKPATVRTVTMNEPLVGLTLAANQTWNYASAPLRTSIASSPLVLSLLKGTCPFKLHPSVLSLIEYTSFQLKITLSSSLYSPLGSCLAALYDLQSKPLICTRGLSEWASEALYACVPARVDRRSSFLGSTSTQLLFVHSSDSIQLLWASSSEWPIQLLPNGYS
jgi:hypothetical protein